MGGASNSPGVLSGNSIQIPVDVPINVCGNSVNVVGALNPVSGNDCGNGSSAEAGHTQTSDGDSRSGAADHAGQNSAGRGSAGHAAGHEETRDGGEGTGRHRASGAWAQGEAKGSPGVASGNQVQVPVSVPLNVCGNGISVGGLLNPVFGNGCETETEPVAPEAPQTPHHPGTPAEPPARPSEPTAPEPQLVPGPELAQTGAGGLDLLIPASAGMLLAGAGAVLYRRSRGAA